MSTGILLDKPASGDNEVIAYLEIWFPLGIWIRATAFSICLKSAGVVYTKASFCK